MFIYINIYIYSQMICLYISLMNIVKFIFVYIRLYLLVYTCTNASDASIAVTQSDDDFFSVIQALQRLSIRIPIKFKVYFSYIFMSSHSCSTLIIIFTPFCVYSHFSQYKHHFIMHSFKFTLSDRCSTVHQSLVTRDDHRRGLRKVQLNSFLL